MEVHEQYNPSLRGVLPKDCAKPNLDKRWLGQLVDLISNISPADDTHGVDVLGRSYEYFLAQFASAEGKHGGEFYTPSVPRPAAGRHAGAPLQEKMVHLTRQLRAQMAEARRWDEYIATWG